MDERKDGSKTLQAHLQFARRGFSEGRVKHKGVAGSGDTVR